MKQALTRSVLFFAFLLCLTTGSVWAQAAQPTPKVEPAEAVTVPKGMKTIILPVQNRDPVMLASVLRGLTSGDRFARVDHNNEFKVITLRDFPENLAVMQDALKRLDVPEAAPVNLEVQLHLIAALQTPTESSGFPAGLDPVVKQLQQTLKFAGYRYITSFVNRVKDGGRVESNGVAGPIFPIPTSSEKTSTFYKYVLNNIRLTTDTNGKPIIQIRDFRFEITLPIQIGSGSQVSYKDIGISTELGLREGELVVVGTSNVGDNAIIVAVTVKKVQ